MSQSFDKFVNNIVEFSGSLTACVLSFVLIICWLLGGLYFGYGEEYQLPINSITTIISFLMLYLIQYSQNKDTKAIQLKLDNLIKSIENADNRLINIESKTEEELREERDKLNRLIEENDNR